MSDLAIGAHCALPRCNVNDFLPIRCKCDQLFCRDHVAPDVHSCPVLIAKADVKVEDGEAKEKEKMQRCAKEGCGKLSLEAFVGAKGAEGRVAALCPRCQQAFCSSHRTPTAHTCTAPDPATPAPRNEAGKALLAKLFPAKDSSPSSPSSSTSSITPSTTTSTTSQTIPAKRKAPTNPKKAAQLRQVELMKMRHRAQPGDPRDKTRHVPVEQRHHLKVSLQTEGGKSEEKLVWFLKDMGTGRALDLLAGQFGVSSDTAPLYLEYTPAEDPEEKVRLQNDKPLADQVADGAQIVLTR